jgi:hypothetical protein
MNTTTTTEALKAELAAILGGVRRRRRLRRAFLGTVWFLIAFTGVALLAALTVDAWRFAPEVVIVARIASYLLGAGALLYFVALPVLQRVSDGRLALYVEEHEPSLAMALASATEIAAQAGESAVLERALLQQTVNACHDIDDGRAVDGAKLRRNGLLAALALAAVVLLASLVPSNLRQALQLVLFPPAGGEFINPYLLDVEPGDILVSKGADQLIVARTEGFEPKEVALLTRFGSDGEWQRAPMIPAGDSHNFEIFLFDLAQSGEYQIATQGLRSPVYRIEVAPLPKVERIDLTYHYPKRLALAPRTVVDGGDISAVRGSRIVITAATDTNVGNASLVLGGRETLPMDKNADGNWSAELTISEEGQYRIDLPYGDAIQVAASPNYAIEVLPDRAPAVKLTRFGRDSQVTSVEEALIEVTGHDDLNIATLELVYAINDQPEETVVLYHGDEAATEIAAEHMLQLEDHALSPGDLVAYYARAADSHGDDARKSTTDIFFMEIRPFNRNFRRGQGGGGAGGMQGGNQERSLSHQQRELVIATFKLARDAHDYEEDRFAETADTLETAQARIRSRVEAIIRRIGGRTAMQKNAGIQRMREELPEAVAAMKNAQQRLLEKSPADALPPARKALQHLQRAEAAFRDAQIAFGQSSGQGAAAAEDLANLFRLEMDKLRNKYESVQHGNWQKGSRQLDEALEKLKELARRQQQEIERLERRAALDPAAPSGGGSQRALAEELEEMVRRLERLSRDQITPELRKLTRQAKAAAEAMRRATAGDANGNGNGVADARAALDRLNNIQRLAENQPRQQLQRGIDKASRQTERLAREHEGIGEAMDALPEDADSRKKDRSKLQSRKLRMAEGVVDLESDLRRLAKDAKDKEEASQALRGAADVIGADALADTIERSAAAMDVPAKETSRRLEARIGESLDRVARGLGEAAEAVEQPEGAGRAGTRAQMRELVKGLESLERRMLQQSRGNGEQPGGARAGWGAADSQSSMDRDFDPTEIADMRRDFAERRGLLERLAGVMNADEHGARDIGRLLNEMRAMEQNRAFDDPQRAVQRQRQLIAQLKELEMRLNGEAENEKTRALLLTGDDAVPSQYRLQVDEYFRELSRAGSAKPVAD